MYKKQIRKLLYRSFDDQLSNEELNMLINTLNSSEKLQKEKDTLALIRAAVSKESGRRFHPYFADRIIRKISEKKETISGKIDDFNASLILSFRKVAIAGVVAILLLLTTNIISEGGISFEKALGLQQVSIEDTWSLNSLISEAVK